MTANGCAQPCRRMGVRASAASIAVALEHAAARAAQAALPSKDRLLGAARSATNAMRTTPCERAPSSPPQAKKILATCMQQVENDVLESGPCETRPKCLCAVAKSNMCQRDMSRRCVAGGRQSRRIGIPAV